MYYKLGWSEANLRKSIKKVTEDQILDLMHKLSGEKKN